MIRSALLSFGMLLLAALASGCSSGACSDASSECVDAHTLRTCSGSVDAVGETRHLRTEACPGENPFCVTPPRTAEMSAFEAANRSFCATSAQPSPECSGRPRSEFCFSGAVSQCLDGFRVQDQSCGGLTCFDSPWPSGTCAACLPPDAGASANCANGARSDCVGNAVLACACGFVFTVQQRCGDQVCVFADGGGEAICALSDQRDPRCVGHDLDLLCAGNDEVVCKYGYDERLETCDAGCNPSTSDCN